MNPRERERRTVTAAPLDELPYRLTGQRSEGFSAELPREDEEQDAARRPGEDEYEARATVSVGIGRVENQSVRDRPARSRQRKASGTP